MKEKSSKKGAEPAKRASVPRMSLTITNELRRKLRIISARNDMEVGEFCKLVLSTAAKRTVEKLYGSEEANRV